MPFILHIAPQIKSKWWSLCNRNFIHRAAPAPAHNTRDKFWLHRVPAHTRYQHRHKQLKKQSRDRLNSKSTNISTEEILHFNAQTNQICFFFSLGVSPACETNQHWNITMFFLFFGQTWLDHWDWVQTGIHQWAGILYKVTLDQKIFRHEMIKIINWFKRQLFLFLSRVFFVEWTSESPNSRVSRELWMDTRIC